jgi:AAA+ ATPase superfamily predicted ATPase
MQAPHAPASPFLGRAAELRLLDELARSERAALLVLYGRRRIGKTRLLTRWIESSGARALYWVAEPTSSLDQLRSFSQALYDFANPGAPAPADSPTERGFTYASWQQALQQVAALAQRERLALFLDEFTYLLQAEPGLAGILQNAWDHSLSKTRLFLALSGSHLGMMERHALSYQAPLYGRATAQLRLGPLPFGVTRAFFPRYGAAERVALYAIFGGVPAYWERVDPAASIPDNIRRQLLTANGLMQAEPRLLLQDFVTEPHNYVAIFRAIAGGARAQNEIVTRTGLAQGHVSKYLSVLREAGFVERQVPATAGDASRLGRYHIVDPYLRFYYRFLSTRQAQLALGLQEPALEEIKSHLLDFIGTHTWEELCREWVLRAGARGILPLSDQVGSHWSRTEQVDVVGINTMEKTLVLGECKWSPREAGVRPLEALVQKTSAVVPATGRWTVHYVGLARGGWSPAAVVFAEGALPSGANWEAASMTLRDLAAVDADLVAWA